MLFAIFLAACIFPTANAELRNLASITYKSSLSGTEITYVFDKPYQCGQYANGDWWAVVDKVTKTVVIKQMTPDCEDGRNGCCVNPDKQDRQSYDNRAKMKFDPSMMPPMPYAAHGEESIVKTVSATAQVGHSYVQYAAVLTVVSSPPENPSATFRPPYAGKEKPLFSTADLQTQLLPSLEPTKGVISQAAAEQLVESVRLDYSSDWTASQIHPIDGRDSWGANMSWMDSEVFFWLCLNKPVKDKMKILIGMVQYGIDLYGARKSLGTKWVHGGGGNGAGRLLPFTFAALMLKSKEIEDELKKSVTAAVNDNTFWESEMFYRGKNNKVLWGNISPYISEDIYWYGISVEPEANKAAADPYKIIDGGSIPGQQYQGCVSLPVKYCALVLHLIPQLKEVWPEKDIKIIEYADRITEEGVHTMPDPFAPPVKLTKEQWKDRTNFGYGKTWGPDPARPGDCIRGEGRFPSLNGYRIVGKPASRTSQFGEEMWDAYRKTR